MVVGLGAEMAELMVVYLENERAEMWVLMLATLTGWKWDAWQVEVKASTQAVRMVDLTDVKKVVVTVTMKEI